MTDAHIAWVGGTGTELTTAVVGGKGRGLDMLMRAGVRVPEAFVVTTQCYRAALSDTISNEISRQVSAVDSIDLDDIDALDRATRSVRQLVVEGTESHGSDQHIRSAYRSLCARVGQDDLGVAVRSSSAAEDASDRSFAGEHDSYLWVVGEQEVSEQVRRCWASLFTSRAISYRARHAAAAAADDDAMAVVVQRMVDARVAGVFMTLNPANGDRSKIVIESTWGLGEPLVSGQTTPDRFTVDKVTREVLDRVVVDKPERAARDPRGTGLAMLPVAATDRSSASLTDEEIAEIVRLGRTVEKFAGCPQDAEFAVGARGGPEQVFLVQSRPETAWSGRAVAPAATGSSTALHRIVSTLTAAPTSA